MMSSLSGHRNHRHSERRHGSKHSEKDLSVDRLQRTGLEVSGTGAKEFAGVNFARVVGLGEW